MAQYIDKDALIAKIEKFIEKAKVERVLHPKTILAAKNYLLIEDYNKLLSFINTLEVKEIDLRAKLEDNDYIEIKTLGELEKYKNKVLLFGYWNKDFPAFAWACKFINAIARFDENEHNSDTPVDKISVTASPNIVEMYNGKTDMSFYPDMTHPLLKPRKVSYGSKDIIFDGQLFIRTLTPIEYDAYIKTINNQL